MFSHTRDIILAAEQAVSTGEADEGLRHLRHLSLDDFGQVLFGLPDDSLPNLSAVFPRMPSEDVQKSWTGHSGVPLLQRTTSFVRSVAYNCQKLLGHGMEDRTILDFGCGYGRISSIDFSQGSRPQNPCRRRIIIHQPNDRNRKIKFCWASLSWLEGKHRVS